MSEKLSEGNSWFDEGEWDFPDLEFAGDNNNSDEESDGEVATSLVLEGEPPFSRQFRAMEEPHAARKPEENEEKRGGTVSWDEVKDLFADGRYEILGHGTSSDDRAENIIKTGLNVGNQSGYDYGRDTGILANFCPLANDNPDRLHDSLNHWEHRNLKEIVLYRIPWQYKTAPGQSVAAYVPFYSGDPIKGTFLPEYAFGWYDAKTDMMHLNPNYHGDLDDENDVAYLEREKARVDNFVED